jgi:hypothetical protein
MNAEHRFLQLEKKLSKNSQLREDYTNFIQEYLQLGHMHPVFNETLVDEVRRNNIFFLPHHAVFKPGSTATTSSISLNGILRTGPTIQQDLLLIVLRIQTHVYAIMADISKMYTQLRFILKTMRCSV